MITYSENKNGQPTPEKTITAHMLYYLYVFNAFSFYDVAINNISTDLSAK